MTTKTAEEWACDLVYDRDSNIRIIQEAMDQEWERAIEAAAKFCDEKSIVRHDPINGNEEVSLCGVAKAIRQLKKGTQE